MSVFLRLWLGQWISNLGTQISLFGLGLWLFQSDGRLGSFALVAVVVQLSRLLVMRVLVRWLERWPRRRVMLLANAVGASGTLGFAGVLALGGGLRSSLVVLPFLALAAAAEAALVLTFSTLIPQLVRRGQRGQANGLFATADGLAALVAPFLGALLLAWTGLKGVVILDGCTFLVALACVALGRWPRRAIRPVTEFDDALPANQGSLRGSIGLVLSHPRLRALMLWGGALMLAFAAAELLFPAWVLQLPDGRERLAVALGCSGLAYGCGVWLWRPLARRPFLWARVFRLGLALQALVLLGAAVPGITRHLWLWYAGVAAFNLAVPLVLASQQGLWQRWVPVAQQPRLFAARYGWDWTSRLVAVTAVGPLVDRVLEPIVGAMGPGAAMPLALGMAGAILAAMQFLHFGAFRSLDERLPRCAS